MEFSFKGGKEGVEMAGRSETVENRGVEEFLAHVEGSGGPLDPSSPA